MNPICILPMGWALVAPPVEAADSVTPQDPVERVVAREAAPLEATTSPTPGEHESGAIEPEPAVSTPTAEPDPAEAGPAPDHPGPAPVELAEPAADAEVPGLWHGFEITSDDEKHRMHLGFLGQMRGTVSDARGVDPSGGVEMRLVRPILDVSLWGGTLGLRVIPELARSPELLDATANLSFHEAANLQVGQFRPWISRGFRTGLNVVGVPGRGRVVDRFRIDRDVGATLRGKVWGGMFEYAVGAFNGSGRGSGTLAPSPLLTARLVVVPLGKVPYTQIPYVRDVWRDDAPTSPTSIAVGGGVYTVATREAVSVRDALGTPVTRSAPQRRWGASGDLVVSRRRLFTMAEGFYEHRAGSVTLGTPIQQAWGVYGQAGVLAWDPYLDIVLRGGVLSDAQGEWSSIEPGVGSYVVGNHAKIQLSYRHDAPLENRLSDAVHTVTLQAQLFF